MESNVTAEDFGASETKFNLKHNVNSASTSAGNTCTMALKSFKGNSLEVLLMHIAKAKLVVKEMPMQTKEELRIFGSTIFKGFKEQNFLIAVKLLPDNLEADLD